MASRLDSLHDQKIRTQRERPLCSRGAGYLNSDHRSRLANCSGGHGEPRLGQEGLELPEGIRAGLFEHQPAAGTERVDGGGVDAVS